MLKKRLNGKKGFTLVEVIVVLVILAILAALLVPKLVGWIDEANQKAAVSDGHLILAAAQTIATEEYAKGTANGLVEAAIKTGITRYLTTGDYNANTTLPTGYTVVGHKIDTFSYTSGAYTVTYTANSGFATKKTT